MLHTDLIGMRKGEGFIREDISLKLFVEVDSLTEGFYVVINLQQSNRVNLEYLNGSLALYLSKYENFIVMGF